MGHVHVGREESFCKISLDYFVTIESFRLLCNNPSSLRGVETIFGDICIYIYIYIYRVLYYLFGDNFGDKFVFMEVDTSCTYSDFLLVYFICECMCVCVYMWLLV